MLPVSGEQMWKMVYIPALFNCALKDISSIVNQHIDPANHAQNLIDTSLNLLVPSWNIQLTGNYVAQLL